LGKFILDGIPPAPRGIPQIEVTFDIDANGILKVTASDKATGRSQNITITASSGLSDEEVEQMRSDAEKHAEEDEHRKDLIEARNNADNVAYSAEKVLKDLGEKVPEEVKSQVESGISKVREAIPTEDVQTIRKATEDLSQILQQVGAAAYQQAGPSAGPGPAGEGEPSGQEDQADEDDEEDIIEGEFTDT
jgi:molecular chaperone DnaK